MNRQTTGREGHRGPRHGRAAILALFAAVVLLAAGALGQTLDEADRLAGSSQWKEAAAAYRRITETIPADGRAWSGLGESELQQGHYDAAQQAFQHAIELKYRPLVNQVNLARTFARGGEHAKALAILRDIAQSQNAGRVRPI